MRKLGITVNLTMKIELIDKEDCRPSFFLLQNHRQRYIMASITSVIGPFVTNLHTN